MLSINILLIHQLIRTFNASSIHKAPRPNYPDRFIKILLEK